MRSSIKPAILLSIILILFILLQPVSSDVSALQGASGLQLVGVGTDQVQFTHNGEPLLSFGGMSDFIFYAADDAYNYRQWADWAAAHGMNHVRAYPPLSWRRIEYFATNNGGSTANVLFPYRETSPGSRQFDLTQFNEAYWDRFRQQLEYLESRGIIVHLLMWNGWQLWASDTTSGSAAEIDWPGHFFNPANNVNSFTDSLGGALSNRYRIYHSVSDSNQQLAEAQRNWFRKLIEETHDLDNVYYDLVHEIAEHYRDWTKTSAWIENMANATRARWSELQPNKPIILGMDTGGLDSTQRDWIFSRPYFDVLIFGKEHTIARARDWRIQYNKPYIPQESWDDNGTKWSYRSPEQRVHLRKYLWKFMMAGVQQMDFYVKYGSGSRPAGFEHNYNPNGWNRFQDDALILRQFWNSLIDYPNLWFTGTASAGPGSHRLVLSSSREAVAYLSSATGQSNVNFTAQTLRLRNLALANGTYTVEIVKPDTGVINTRTVSVTGGSVDLSLPAFTDDLAVHIFTVSPTPTLAPTETATATFTETPTATETPSPTDTPSPTSTETATLTFTPTFTETFTLTAIETPTPTHTPTSALTDVSAPALRVEVIPSSAASGEQIAVGLQLVNVTGLYGLEVQCQVDPNVLTGNDVVGGEGFNSENSFFVDHQYQTDDGSWLVAASRMRPNPAIDGSMTAFTLIYTVQGAGSSQVTCSALGADANGHDMALEVINGSFNTTSSATPSETPQEISPTPTDTPTTEITPTSISGQSSITGIITYPGRSTHAGITVQLVDTQDIIVNSTETDTSGAYRFTNVPIGAYTIRASAPQHLTLSGSVLVETDGQTIDMGSHSLVVGDTDGNQVIDLADAIFVAANYGVTVPPAPPNADLNGDHIVDIFDLTLVGGNMGLTGSIVIE